MARAAEAVPTRRPSRDLPTTLNLRRVFDAPRDLVWLAWTRPEMTVRWLGPVEWPATCFTQDLRVGGAWAAVLESADGKILRQGGTYHVVEPPHRLVFTFAWGEDHEDGPAVETVVSIHLTALSSEQTLMDFAQTGLKSGASAGGHRHGWTGSFERLEEWLANQHGKEKQA